MILPNHKTKIVATIGPASNSPEMLERVIRAGVNVARLNFSHGTHETHAATYGRVREAAKDVDQNPKFAVKLGCRGRPFNTRIWRASGEASASGRTHFHFIEQPTGGA